MSVYDFPGVVRHLDLRYEVTVKVSLWGVAKDGMEAVAKEEGIDLCHLGYLSTSHTVFRMEAVSKKHVGDVLRLLRPLKPNDPARPIHDLWFQHSLDGFRDLSYLHNFLIWCRSTPQVSDLQVGAWGKGAMWGKASVILRLNSVIYGVLIETLEEIYTALG